MNRAPLFLARQGYRRRRLTDMARLMPMLGLALFLLPLLDAAEGLDAATLVYLFLAWAGLILASALLSRHQLRAEEGEAAEAPPAEGP